MEEKISNVAYYQEGRPQPFFAKQKIWLNAILFVATVFSTFFVGLMWAISFKYADIVFQESQSSFALDIFMDPEIIGLGMIYVIVLIGILMGHELGHFFTCRYYKINATLPYFIPAPTLIGTLGAFIKIKSPITKKQQLFDIGVAGPLVGFVLSVPALIYGLSLSKIIPSLPPEESIIFGEPLLLKIVGGVIFKGIPEGFDVFPHPIAFAGWVGILVTALNLFPIGQLDGGHVFYAFLGAKSRKFAPIFLAVFVFMGIFFWVGWFVWALLISFVGLKHPRISDEEIPLSPRRKFIVFVIFLIFIFSFIPDPVKGYNLFDLLKQFTF